MGRSRRAADHDDDPHGVRAMAASVILLVDVDAAYDGPAPLYGLALFDYNRWSWPADPAHRGGRREALTLRHGSTRELVDAAPVWPAASVAGKGRGRAAGLMGLRNGRVGS